MNDVPSQKYMVMVVTLTYNHRCYIEDTLKSIIMQQTNFPFVACVLDDCSTDGTTDVIRRYEDQYPDIIKGIYFEENQFSQGKFTYEALIPWFGKVKYIALCEGDDYWTDPLKLQKQVDFMESHLGCTLSFHRVMEHWQDGSAPDKVFFPVEDRAYSGAEIFINWVVSGCSVLVRSYVFDVAKVREIFSNTKLLYFDQALYMYCATVGEIIGMSDVMGVYRRLYNGQTHSLHSNLETSSLYITRFCNHNKEMKKLFGTVLGTDFNDFVDYQIVKYSINGSILSVGRGNIKEGCFFLKESLKCSPIKTVTIGMLLITKCAMKHIGINPTRLGNYIRGKKNSFQKVQS